jgi:hypothetical protein
MLLEVGLILIKRLTGSNSVIINLFSIGNFSNEGLASRCPDVDQGFVKNGLLLGLARHVSPWRA